MPQVTQLISGTAGIQAQVFRYPRTSATAATLCPQTDGVGDREEDTCTQRDRRDSEIEGDKERYRDRNTETKKQGHSHRERDWRWGQRSEESKGQKERKSAQQGNRPRPEDPREETDREEDREEGGQERQRQRTPNSRDNADVLMEADTKTDGHTHVDWIC